MGILGLWPEIKARFPDVSASLPRKTRDGVGAIAVDMNSVLRSLPLTVIEEYSRANPGRGAAFLVQNVWGQVVGFAKTQFSAPPDHYFLVYDNSDNLPVCRNMTHEKRMPKWTGFKRVPAGKVVCNGRVYACDEIPYPADTKLVFMLGHTLPVLKRVLNTPAAFRTLKQFVLDELMQKAIECGVHIVISPPGRDVRIMCSCPPSAECKYGMHIPVVYGEADLIIPSLLRKAIQVKIVTMERPMWIFKSSDTDHVVIYSIMPRFIAEQVRWVRGTRAKGYEAVHMGRVWECMNARNKADNSLVASRLAGLLCCGSDYVVKPIEISGSGFFAGAFCPEFRPFLVQTQEGWMASWSRFVEFLNLCGNKAKRKSKELPTQREAFILMMQCMFATVYYASFDGCPDATEFGWQESGLRMRLPPDATHLLPNPPQHLPVTLVHEPWLDDSKFAADVPDVAVIYHNCTQA